MRGFRKIKINKPELMSSINMCMSGIDIRIEYLNETENEYLYNWGAGSKFSIDRSIYNDNKISLGVSHKGKSYFFQTDLRILKNRNEFLDWTVKKLESLYLQ